MPLYEYKCEKCSETFEMLQKINSEPLTKCIYCNGDIQKLISVSSFRLKGNGWYLTDYKKSSTKSKSDKKVVSNTKADTSTKTGINAGASKNAAIK